MAKVKFTKSPTGAFNLGYSAGQEGEVSDELAKQLIKEGFAVPVAETKKQTATKKNPKIEKRG